MNINMDEDSNIIRVDISQKNCNQDFSNIFKNRRYILDSYDDEVIVTIAIVAYNRLDITKLCVESVLRYTTDINYKLILVYNENKQGEGILDYFKSISFDKKIIINISENLGAPLAYQQIQKYIEGNYFVHLPNDVIVTQNWLSNLIKCAESDDKIGMVNPVSSNVSNLQQVNLEFNCYDEMQNVAAEYNVSDPTKWHERIRIITLGTLFKRECLSAIGDIFDIGFIHNFGDDDVSFRVRRAGYKAILACDTWVHHAHENITRNSVDLESGRKCFREKYFGIDAWDDTCNYIYDDIKNSITMPKDFESTRILGIDVRCGTPLLDIKNILREYGIFKTDIHAFTQDAMYVLDLKTISNSNVECDKIDFLCNAFETNFFDFIVLGKCINEYHVPEKVVHDAYTLLKPKGQMFISLKNTYNVYTLIKILGYNIDYLESTVHYNVDDFYSLIRNMGMEVQIINTDYINAEEIILNYSSKILDFGKADNVRTEDLLGRLMVDKYWIKITKSVCGSSEL